MRRVLNLALASFIFSISSFTNAEDREVNTDNNEDDIDVVNESYVVEASYFVENINGGTKTDTPVLETPQSISVINRDQLDARGVSTFNEALRYSPGVQPEPFGFEPRYTNLMIRGFDAATTGFFKDGLLLANPSYAVSYNLEPWGAERIEIPRGPSSILYGQGSAGGLVNFVSKRPRAGSVQEYVLEYGSYERKQAKFDVGGSINDDDEYMYRLVGLYLDSDTQVDFLPFNREYLAPSFTWNPNDDTSLTLLANYQQDDSMNSQALPASGTLTTNPNGDIPISRFTGEPDVDKVDRTEFQVGYEFEHIINPVLTFRQNTRYNYAELDDIVVYSSSIIDSRTVGRSVYENFGTLGGLTIDNQLQFKFGNKLFEHTVVAGLDYQFIDIETVQFFGAMPSLDLYNPVYGNAFTAPGLITNNDIEKTQLGFYFQDQLKLNKKWILTFGGRYDDASSKVQNNLTNTLTEQDDDAFSGRAGLTYLADNGLAPYVSYSESFIPIIGLNSVSQNFEPEVGKQYEAGIKYQPSGWNSFITMAVFEITRENFTEILPVAPFSTVQTGEVRSRGFEFEAVANLDFGLDLVASYTNMKVEVTESANAAIIGKRIRWVPDEMASFRADYTFRKGPLNGLRIGSGLRYQGSNYGDTANTLEAPGFTVVDAGIHYDWKDLRFGVTAQNLLDEEYVGSCFVRGGGNFCSYGESQNVRGTISVLF